MRRWKLALSAALLLVAVSAPSASATTIDLYVKWRPLDSNKTKTYTFNQNFTSCTGGDPTYRLTMAVNLGTVNATTAYVKSIKLTWSNFAGGNPNAIWAVQTSISDDDGHATNGTENPPQNYEGGTFTLGVSKTFHFSTTNFINIKQTDAWPVSYLGGCRSFSKLHVTYAPNPN